ncbi:MAG: stage V sporulation protein AC [Christensenellaceae bacterium]|nr:stage V sporulation protein AC [Christensenellaceae bacterium]
MNEIMDKQEYAKLVRERMPKSKTGMECLRAFLVGGLICVLGELLHIFYLEHWQMSEDNAAAMVSITLIFMGALLTGLGVYDIIGKFAGAGSIVPISGYANSVTAPALEFKREGFILGVGAKLFTIAGPVLVYGITSSILVGVLYCIFGGIS